NRVILRVIALFINWIAIFVGPSSACGAGTFFLRVDCSVKRSGSNFVLTSDKLDGKNPGPVNLEWVPSSVDVGKSKGRMKTTNTEKEEFVAETKLFSNTVAAKLEKANGKIDENRMKVTLTTRKGQTLSEVEKEEIMTP
ncbi:hypothetical protein BaRGS_00040578, partial [Batillaria attramentaria]